MARRILAIILLAMALGQLTNPIAFIDIIETYEVGGRTFAWVLGFGLFIGEVTGGIGLLLPTPPKRRLASRIALVVTLVWSALALQAFARGLALDNCGCFGVHLAQELRWWILLEDAEFVALAVWVAHDLRPRGRSDVTPSLSAR